MRAVWLAGAILTATVSPLRAQSIGIFADVGGGSCAVTAPLASPFQYYVLVRLGPLSGVTGAEFRIEGVDPAWFTTVSPQPLICDPGCPDFVGDGGAVTFPSCQAPGSGQMVLLTIQSIAFVPIPTRTLRIEAARFPSHPGFACPLVTLCDPPVFTRMCVAGGAAVVNGACTVAVRDRTWSSVKAMFD